MLPCLLVRSFVECRMDEVEMMGRMECLVILVVFVERVVWVSKAE